MDNEDLQQAIHHELQRVRELLELCKNTRADARAEAFEECARMLDEWAGADAKLEFSLDTTAEALSDAARCIRGLKTPNATKQCGCEGCEEQVPLFYRAGLCASCLREDCEHSEDDVNGSWP